MTTPGVSATTVASVRRALKKGGTTDRSAAMLLLLGTVIAIVWANSPWGSSYEEFWQTPIEVTIGSGDGFGRWKSSCSAIADEDPNHERAGEERHGDDPELERQGDVLGGGFAVEHGEILGQPGPVEANDDEEQREIRERVEEEPARGGR